MNKICFLLFCLTTISVTLLAQTTSYYKLVKKVNNGVTSTIVSGGQFITFMGDICYESNKKGIGVGHGTLMRNDSYSTASIKTYTGKSYWGEGAVFKFTTDLATLNVVTEDGVIYLYKRTSAPANATTCSLIRKSSGNSSGGGVVLDYSQPIYSNGSYNNSSYDNNGTNRANNNQQVERREPTKHKCTLCHGNGTIVRETNIATYGRDEQLYCSQCGRNYYRSSGHSHVRCSQCNGKGWY
jgi:hypothetical protein